MSETGPTITVESAAKLLLKTPRHVQRLTKEGWIKKADDGRYTVISVVQGYIKWRDDAERRRTQSASRAAVDDVKTKLLQLRLDSESKKLIPMEEAFAALDFIAGTLKSEFLGFPAAITRDLALRNKLEEGINAIFARAVERIVQERERITAGE